MKFIKRINDFLSKTNQEEITIEFWLIALFTVGFIVMAFILIAIGGTR